MRPAPPRVMPLQWKAPPRPRKAVRVVVVVAGGAWVSVPGSPVRTGALGPLPPPVIARERSAVDRAVRRARTTRRAGPTVLHRPIPNGRATIAPKAAG